MTFVGSKSVAISAGTGGDAITEQFPATADLAYTANRFPTYSHAQIMNYHATQTITITGTAIANSMIVAPLSALVFAPKHGGTIIMTGSGASTTAVLTYGRVYG